MKGDTNKVWAVLDNGAIEFVTITLDIYDKCLEFIAEHYLKYEITARISGVNDNPLARKEVAHYICMFISDGVSIAAVEKATGRILLVSINIIETAFDLDNYYCLLKTKYTQKETKAFLDWERDIQATNGDINGCGLQLAYAATIPEFRGKGLLKASNDVCLRIAEGLVKGEIFRYALDGTQHDTNIKLDHISALSTTPYSRAVLNKKQFKEVHRIYLRNIFKHNIILDDIQDDLFTFHVKKLI